jgi:hypothetical protein
MNRSFKVPRRIREKMKRKPAKQSEYVRYKIRREPPPKEEKKIVARQELIKDEKTGKAKYQTVYEVKNVPDDKFKKKLAKSLYIPKHPPPKEIRYYRDVKPQFKDIKIKYEDPSRYGDLRLYKKSRIIEIAKNKYGLPDKLAGKLDKDELVDFINFKFEGKDKVDQKFAKTKIKLAKIEPIRGAAVTIKKSQDPTKPYKKTIKYGALQQTGKKAESAEEKLNAAVKANPNFRNVAPFGTYRKFDEHIYQAYKAGNVNLENLVDELVTHLNISDKEKLNLKYLAPDQIEKLYKKAYKQSTKGEQAYEGKIFMPKLQYQRAPNFAKAPEFRDYTGKSHVVGSIAPPIAYSEIDDDFDYKEYEKPKSLKKIEKLENILPQTAFYQQTGQDINDLRAQLTQKEMNMTQAFKQGDQQLGDQLKLEVKALKDDIKTLRKQGSSSSAPPSKTPSKTPMKNKKGKK